MVEVTCEKTINLVFWITTNMRHLYSFWVLFFCYSVDSSIHPLNNWDLMVINISQSCTWSYISNTRKSVSSDIQTLRRGLKKRGAAECFKPTSKCLDIWWNTLPHVWYSFSKLIFLQEWLKIILGEIQIPNFLFCYHELLINLRTCIWTWYMQRNGPSVKEIPQFNSAKVIVEGGLWLMPKLITNYLYIFVE